MILIDANALLVLIVGLIDPKLIGHHKRTSIYDEEDFINLVAVIQDLENLIVLPNVWTEVDNLLNDFRGGLKETYISTIISTIKKATEKFLKSVTVVDMYEFYDLGLTDTLLLEYAKKCDFLITSDSSLSDYAVANGVKVYDLVKARNERL